MKLSEYHHVELAKNVSEKIQASLKNGSSKLDKCDTGGGLARARALAFGGYFDEAIDVLEQARAIDPSSDEVLARLTVLLLLRERVDEGLETAVALAGRSPDYAFVESTSDEVIGAYTLLGDALARNGRDDDAVRAYELARKHTPKDTTSAARLAVHHIEHGRSDEAMQQFDVFAANPRHQWLAGLMELGKVDVSLLPRFKMSEVVGREIVGRPLTVAGSTPRVASVVEGDDAWCAGVGTRLD